MCGKFIPRTHQRNKPVAEFVANNFALDRKIKEALGDVPKSTQWLLMELPRDEDKELIVADFVINWSNESEDGMPISPNTKTTYVSALVCIHLSGGLTVFYSRNIFHISNTTISFYLQQVRY